MRRDWREAADGVICLLLVVVRIRDCRESAEGRYEATLSVRSEMLEVEGSENETVDGSDRPGKEESRTLTFEDAILDKVARRLLFGSNVVRVAQTNELG